MGRENEINVFMEKFEKMNDAQKRAFFHNLLSQSESAKEIFSDHYFKSIRGNEKLKNYTPKLRGIFENKEKFYVDLNEFISSLSSEEYLEYEKVSNFMVTLINTTLRTLLMNLDKGNSIETIDNILNVKESVIHSLAEREKVHDYKNKVNELYEIYKATKDSQDPQGVTDNFKTFVKIRKMQQVLFKKMKEKLSDDEKESTVDRLLKNQNEYIIKILNNNKLNEKDLTKEQKVVVFNKIDDSFTYEEDLEQNMNMFNSIVEQLPKNMQIVPNDEEILTTFEAEMEPKLKEIINAFEKELENNKQLTEEAKQAIEIAHNLCVDYSAQLSGDLSSNAEDLGRKIHNIHTNKYNEYMEKEELEKIDYEIGQDNINEIEKRRNNYNNNENPKLSIDYKKKISELIEYAKKNNLYNPNINQNKVFYTMGSTSTKLKEALESKNLTDVIKYSQELQNKVNAMDHLIKELKEMNVEHLYTSNLSDSRSPYFPGKYRTDVEGTTLVNQMFAIMDVCKNFKVSVEDLLNKPAETIKKIYDDKFNEVTSFNNLDFHEKNGFEVLDILSNKRITVFEDIENLSDLEKLFGQLDASLFFSHKEDLQEFYRYNAKVISIGRINRSNANLILKIIGSDSVGESESNYEVQVAANLLMQNKQYTGINDFVLKDYPVFNINTMEYYKPFNIKEYAKEQEAIDLLNNVEDQQANYKKAYEKSNNKEKMDQAYEIFRKTTAETIKEKVAHKYDSLDANSKSYLDKLNNSEDLTPIQMNTLKGSVEFAIRTKDGIDKDSAKNGIKAIAELRKQYYSHNPFARLLYKNLRCQNEAIKTMKQELINRGINAKDLDKALNEYLKTEVDSKEIFEEKVDKLIKDLPQRKVEGAVEEEVIENNELLNQINSEEQLQKEVQNEVNPKQNKEEKKFEVDSKAVEKLDIVCKNIGKLNFRKILPLLDGLSLDDDFSKAYKQEAFELFKNDATIPDAAGIITKNFNNIEELKHYIMGQNNKISIPFGNLLEQAFKNTTEKVREGKVQVNNIDNVTKAYKQFIPELKNDELIQSK